MELNHLAIILDGNGRWAKSKGLPRNYGHIEGAKNVERIIDAADDLGIKYVTMYAFSTENWKRPKAEVAALMKLLRNYLKTCHSPPSPPLPQRSEEHTSELQSLTTISYAGFC